jgi:hypothetical protein
LNDRGSCMASSDRTLRLSWMSACTTTGAASEH